MSMMGEMNYFLGLQVKQIKDDIFINQAKYTRDLLLRFQTGTAKLFDVPMNPSMKLDLDDGSALIDSTMYRGLIGSLLYLTASRPDITYAVGVYARYQSSPRQSHLDAAKRILRYLKGTVNLGLWYPRDDNFHLCGYSDSDFGGCRVDRKSTSGTCQFLGSKLISWFSKKQHSIAISTTEAEYVAAGSCCAQILWMRQQRRDYNEHTSEVSFLVDLLDV